jgi:ElaB/YqjD/DUF883 family membrane-anchored ribosome-binding protein
METRNMGSAGSTLEDASTRASAAAGRMSERAHDAVDQMSGRVQDMTQRLGEQGQEWMERSDEMMESVRNYVREKPMVAIGIAAGVGFLLSRLLR